MKRRAFAPPNLLATVRFAAGESIWGDLKDFLFDLFDQHCAYCECDLLADSFGAVEHYRPKNAVRGVADHPGYYWRPTAQSRQPRLLGRSARRVATAGAGAGHALAGDQAA